MYFLSRYSYLFTPDSPLGQRNGGVSNEEQEALDHDLAIASITTVEYAHAILRAFRNDLTNDAFVLRRKRISCQSRSVPPPAPGSRLANWEVSFFTTQPRSCSMGTS